jgi:hypothetical protein
VNVGKTRIEGVEISLAGQAAIAGGPAIHFMAGYTYLNPRQIEYDSAYVRKIGYANYLGSDSSNLLKYRYRHMVKGDLEISYRRFSAGTSLRFTSRMENIDKIFLGGLLDIAFPPGLGIADYRKYHDQGDLVADARVSCDLTQHFKVAFIVKNLANHIFMQRPADMQPPRSFVLQAGLKF